MSNICLMFESALYRPEKCKHCFKNRSDHMITINSSNSNQSNSTNSNNSTLNKADSSSNKDKVDIALRKVPNSIRRSLTPQSIKLYSKELSSISPNKDQNNNNNSSIINTNKYISPIKHQSVSLPNTPLSISNNSSNSNNNNKESVTLSPLIISSNNSYKRPLPAVPNKLKSSSGGSNSTTPNQSPLSTSPLSSNSSSFILLDDNNSNISNISNISNSSSNNNSPPMIESFNITNRPNRSHSDTPSGDKPPLNNSLSIVKNELSNSNTPILVSSPKFINPTISTTKKHNKSNSNGNDKLDSLNINSGAIGGSLQFSSSPSLTGSNSIIPPSTPPSTSSGNLGLKLHQQQSISQMAPSSPNNRKYSNIAKSFIKFGKLNKKSTSSSSVLSSSSASKLSTIQNLQLQFNDENIEPQNKILYSVQAIISSIPGISTNSVYAIMDILNSQTIDIDYHSYVNDENLENLKKSNKTLEKWIESQEEVRKVIIVQSCVRRFLARKRFEWLNEVYTKSILKERNIAFRQLIQMERKYNFNLNIIINQYYKPLKSLNLLLEIDFKSIFASIEDIYHVHQKILHQFEQLFSKWPCIEGLGEFFLRIAPELKVYGDYVKNFKNAIDTLNRCQEDNLKFSNFLEETTEQTPGKVLDLMALIATPLNHLSIYERQLSNISNSTPSNWVDYHNINNSVIMMKEVELSVQENLALSQNASTLMNIYRKVNNKKAMDQFVKPGRIFIHEGKLIKFDPKKKDQIYYYNLCNDVILFVKKSKDKEILNFKNIFNLSDVIVNDLSDNQNYKNIISIQNVKTNEIYTFSIEEKNDKISLIKQFSKLCTTNKSTKIFGTSLLDLLNRDNDAMNNIPTFIMKICDALTQYINVEGIFRISPNQSEVDQFKEQFNKATSDDILDQIISKITSGHILAALLKSYFRELSPPLLTYDLFDRIVELGDKDLPGVELIPSVKSLLATIPLANQNTLHLLLKLLQFIATNSEKNKMTHSNLAIVFGPNLLKPQTQTIESSLKIPIINNLIAALLDNYELLYPIDNIKIINNNKFQLN